MGERFEVEGKIDFASSVALLRPFTTELGWDSFRSSTKI